MSDVKLGELPTGPVERDAIHVAVIPMVAGEMLRPGDRVGVLRDGVACRSENVVGIVDPYLTDVVPKGATFWMCLLPGTVTGMRHHWLHPVFGEGAVAALPGKAEAELWLRSYANRVNSCCDDSEVAFNRLIDGLRTGRLSFYGTGLNGRYDLDDEEELRRNAEIYLGCPINFDDFSFSCSC